MFTHAIGLVAISLGLASAAQGDMVVIDFESDAPGGVPNGFVSNSSPLVSFSDSDGAELMIADFGIQSIGQALAVGTDIDGSFLIMDFSVIIDSLSLDFGNDDPAFSLPGDFAILTAYLDGIEVGTTEVEMNRDDAMNQNIAFAGAFFNSASLEFYVSSDGLTEIVDNVTFNSIPAPGIPPLALLAGLSCTRRRRRCD